MATTTKAKTRTKKTSRVTVDEEPRELLKRVETILKRRLDKLESSQGETSTAELSKILELLERVIEEQPRHVTVEWVEPCRARDESSED